MNDGAVSDDKAASRVVNLEPAAVPQKQPVDEPADDRSQSIHHQIVNVGSPIVKQLTDLDQQRQEKSAESSLDQSGSGLPEQR